MKVSSLKLSAFSRSVTGNKNCCHVYKPEMKLRARDLVHQARAEKMKQLAENCFSRIVDESA